MALTRTSWRMAYMKLQGELARGRKRAGLTQAQMAESLGVGLATFQRWELGTGAAPRADQLFHWAHIVRIDITSAERINADVREAA